MKRNGGPTSRRGEFNALLLVMCALLVVVPMSSMAAAPLPHAQTQAVWQWLSECGTLANAECAGALWAGPNAEFGIDNPLPASPHPILHLLADEPIQAFNHSALRIPHSAFRTSHSLHESALLSGTRTNRRTE